MDKRARRQYDRALRHPRDGDHCFFRGWTWQTLLRWPLRPRTSRLLAVTQACAPGHHGRSATSGHEARNDQPGHSPDSGDRRDGNPRRSVRTASQTGPPEAPRKFSQRNPNRTPRKRVPRTPAPTCANDVPADFGTPGLQSATSCFRSRCSSIASTANTISTSAATALFGAMWQQ